METDADKLAKEAERYLLLLGNRRVPTECLMNEVSNRSYISGHYGSLWDEYARWTDQPLSFEGR